MEKFLDEKAQSYRTYGSARILLSAYEPDIELVCSPGSVLGTIELSDS
jgi:hypothetical protein